MAYALPPRAASADHRDPRRTAHRAHRNDLLVALAVAPALPAAPDAAASARLIASARDRVWGLLSTGDELRIGDDGILFVRVAHHFGERAVRRVSALATTLARRPLQDADGHVHVDVGVSWSRASGRRRATPEQLAEHARELLTERDLQPRKWTRGSRERFHARRPQTLLQYLVVLSLTFLMPLGAMLIGHRYGVPVAGVTFTVVITVLVISALLQWSETILGLASRPHPPPARGRRPPASAIIAAYLPNEADTILATLRAFLTHHYDGGLQVILAYNTPHRLPVEDALEALAEREPRLQLVRVADSTSKAQNVNAALAVVTGEFVGVFDADHHPDPGAFRRASRWFQTDVDVVQGHCVVRNGDASAIARTVAVEFEQIYAVSHRGRQVLHGFGVFGGSNGYWRTDLIRTIRMMPSMLTEDIDSSIRANRAGARIVNDPRLVSRELAPVTISALWRQRMRWAQGWAQVTAAHAAVVLHGDELTPRQRAGMFFHLVWREAYPMISALMWPVLAFYLWRDGAIGFANPALLMLTVFTLASTPLQVLLVHSVADRKIADRRSWWVWYLVIGSLAYQEFRNTIARIALVKLAMGERNWVVTPRAEVPREVVVEVPPIAHPVAVAS